MIFQGWRHIGEAVDPDELQTTASAVKIDAQRTPVGSFFDLCALSISTTLFNNRLVVFNEWYSKPSHKALFGYKQVNLCLCL